MRHEFMVPDGRCGAFTPLHLGQAGVYELNTVLLEHFLGLAGL